MEAAAEFKAKGVDNIVVCNKNHYVAIEHVPLSLTQGWCRAGLVSQRSFRHGGMGKVIGTRGFVLHFSR